jgi:hypothetical protein
MASSNATSASSWRPWAASRSAIPRASSGCGPDSTRASSKSSSPFGPFGMARCASAMRNARSATSAGMRLGRTCLERRERGPRLVGCSRAARAVLEPTSEELNGAGVRSHTRGLLRPTNRPVDVPARAAACADSTKISLLPSASAGESLASRASASPRRRGSSPLRASSTKSSVASRLSARVSTASTRVVASCSLPSARSTRAIRTSTSELASTSSATSDESLSRARSAPAESPVFSTDPRDSAERSRDRVGFEQRFELGLRLGEQPEPLLEERRPTQPQDAQRFGARGVAREALDATTEMLREGHEVASERERGLDRRVELVVRRREGERGDEISFGTRRVVVVHATRLAQRLDTNVHRALARPRSVRG